MFELALTSYKLHPTVNTTWTLAGNLYLLCLFRYWPFSGRRNRTFFTITFASYLLVKQLLHLQGFHHIGDELRVDVGVSDLLVQQLSHGPLMFGADLLGLVTHI